MKKLVHLTPVAVGLLLAACGKGDAPPADSVNATETVQPATAEAETSASQTGGVHSAQGDVTEVTTDSITISHGPIESAGWRAMTMNFKAPPKMIEGLRVADPVNFSFKQRNGDYVLTSIGKRQFGAAQ